MFADAPRAGLIRRLAAMMYDWLILAALWMATTGLAFLILHIASLVDFVSLSKYGEPADLLIKYKIWFQLYSVAWFFWFYLYFWYKGGQTLGMRAWRLMLVQQNGEAISFKQAVVRALTALLGVGNIWLWLRWGKGLALQDQLTHTKVIVLSKEQSKLVNLHKAAR